MVDSELFELMSLIVEIELVELFEDSELLDESVLIDELELSVLIELDSELCEDDSKHERLMTVSNRLFVQVV